MKKVIISSLAVIMILSVQQIWAQRSPSGKIDRLKTELDLSDDQAAQIEKIFESKHEEMMALRNDDDKSHDEKKAAMKDFRNSVDKEIESVLNEDQITKFQEIQKERKEHHGRKGKGKGHSSKFKDGKGKELHAQIKAYKDQNVKPVMLEQRAKLDPKISDDDKQLIAEMRVEFEKMRAERQARFEERKADGKQKKSKDYKENKEKQHKTGDENREKMKSLVEKYKADIEPLFAEIADQQEKWKADIHEITKKTLELENDEECQNMKRKHGHRGDHKESRQMAHFLLLDPSEKNGANAPQSLISEVTAFPNPVTTVTTIEYELVENGQVLIELRDSKGKFLKTLKDEIQEKGVHRQTVTFDNYQGDLFYIVITDKNGLATTKNIVRVR